MPDVIEHVRVSALKPYARNTRTHSKRQIEQIARSIERFGFTNPVLVDDELTIIAGHGRVEAAKRLGLGDVPIIRLSRMSAADIRAYRIADNRLAELAGWDNELLAIELQGLTEIGFDVELTGFAVAEIDLIIDSVAEADPSSRRDAEDALPDLPREAITELGDVWRLGRHRLICGDAREPD
ncbi:MAG: ParB/Srx family N-terminal domain-containing protein [Hyphomonadaceae bacterium]